MEAPQPFFNVRFFHTRQVSVKMIIMTFIRPNKTKINIFPKFFAKNEAPLKLFSNLCFRLDHCWEEYVMTANVSAPMHQS